MQTPVMGSLMPPALASGIETLYLNAGLMYLAHVYYTTTRSNTAIIETKEICIIFCSPVPTPIF